MKFNLRIREYSRIRYPLLFLDYLLWLFFDFSKFTRIRKEKIKKVLVIHSGAIGELIAMTPILRALKKELRCKITCMISRGKEELIECNPHVDEIIFIEGDIKSRIALLKEKKFDLSIIYQASFINGLMCYRAGIPYRIGIFSRIKRFPTLFYTRRTFPTRVRHTVAQSLEALKKAGIKDDGWRTEIKIPKIKMRNIIPNNYAIIHPGFGPSKRSWGPPRLWPIKNYSEIADLLVKKYKLNIIITGADYQKKMGDEVITGAKNKKKITNLCGKTSIKELIAIVKKAKIVIAPDTGTGHIAAAIGTPLVNLMVSPLEESRPIGDNKKIVNINHIRQIVLLENGKLYSSIGGVASIKKEEVIEAIHKLLD